MLRDIRLGFDNKRAILLAEVLALRVRPDLVGERDRLDVAKMGLIGRLAGADYVRLSDVFSIPRVTPADLAERGSPA